MKCKSVKGEGRKKQSVIQQTRRREENSIRLKFSSTNYQKKNGGKIQFYLNFLLLKYPVSEFNEFKPRPKFAKNRFQLSAGLNLEKLNTILSETNHI